MTSYTVTVSREEPWWVAVVNGLPGGATEARRLSQLRLGRLNRLGRYPHAGGEPVAAPAIVVHDGEANAPIYGTATGATWAHLLNLIQPVPALDGSVALSVRA